jgi:hypothetical protein
MRILVGCLAVVSSGLVSSQEPAPPPQPEPERGVVELPGIRKLTITGQYRIRYENLYEFDFDRDRGASNDYFTQRVRLGFDAVLGDGLSAFAQIQDAREWGEEASTIDDDAEGLDLHQGYLQIDDVPWVGGKSRIGRQAVSLGDQRLVGALEWKSQARVFDGVRQTWDCGDGWQLDGFAFQTRELLNAVNDDAFFAGAYASGAPHDALVVDLYAMLLHDEMASSGGTDSRVTLGTRQVWNEKQPLELGTELVTQTGESNDAQIPFLETFAVHGHATWRPEAEIEPWLRLELNLASGDDPATRDNERFNNLFPTGHAHWGMMDLAAWENLFDAMVEVGVKPTSASRASIAWHLFRSLEAGDRFGGPNGTVTPGGIGFSREIGHEIDLIWRVDFATKPAKTSLEAGYGVFVPGDGVEQARGSDDVAHFVYVQGDVRF